ncbi:MAG: twin-arginine translocation signal domain-containing protein [Thiolinea sp.]
MTEQTSLQTAINKSRRNFIKGTAAISALAMGGLSGLAVAARSKPGADVLSGAAISAKPGDRILGDSGIKIIQETLYDREKVTLINQSDKLQMLDARQPVSLYQTGDGLVVTVNQDDAKAVNGMLVMSPGDQWEFDVKAIGIEVRNHTGLPLLTGLAEHQLQISSTHSVFNRVLPVQVV